RRLLLFRARGVGLQRRLGELQVPIAILVPRELVGGLCGEVESILGDACAHCLDRRAEPRADPAIEDAERRARIVRSSGGRLGSLDLHQYVARGVPELVAEVLVALDTPQVEANIAAHRRERTEREAQRIGAVSGNALRELLAGVLLDLVFEMRLHESARALC